MFYAGAVCSQFLFTQTAKEFTGNYTERLYSNAEFNQSALHAIAFDTVWTLALVLNYTEEMRWKNVTKEQVTHENCSSDLTGDLVALNEFNYSNAYMGCVMKHNFYKVNFTGVSVNLRSCSKFTITLCTPILSTVCTIFM